MNKKWFCIVVAAVLLVSAVLVAGCAPEKAGTIKVGMAMTMSGPAARIGTNVANGVRMAVKHWNDEGGVKVGGKIYQIELVEYDTAMKPDQGVSATRRLIEQDKVVAIFGDCISTVALAQKPIVEAAGIPWMTMGSHPDLTKDSKYTFRSNNLINDTYEEVITWAVKEYGLTKWSQLDEESALTLDIKEHLAQVIPSIGGSILTADTFPAGNPDFYPLLTRIKSAGPQAVFSGTAGDAPTILKQANEIGLKVQWIFTNQLKSHELVEQTGELAVGVWQVVTYDPAWDRDSVRTFNKEAEALIGRLPTSSEALGYEGPMRMFMAMEKAKSLEADKIVEALYQVDWEGAFFIGKYDRDGECTSSSMLMQIMADGTYAEIKK